MTVVNFKCQQCNGTGIEDMWSIRNEVLRLRSQCVTVKDRIAALGNSKKNEPLRARLTSELAFLEKQITLMIGSGKEETIP